MVRHRTRATDQHVKHRTLNKASVSKEVFRTGSCTISPPPPPTQLTDFWASSRVAK